MSKKLLVIFVIVSVTLFGGALLKMLLPINAVIL